MVEKVKQFKVDTIIRKRGGEAVKDQTIGLCPECRAKYLETNNDELTIGAAMWASLNHDDIDEKTGKRKIKRAESKSRAKLCRRIERAEDSDDQLIQLADAEIEEICELATKTYPQIVAGQVCLLLEEPYEEPKEEETPAGDGTVEDPE